MKVATATMIIMMRTTTTAATTAAAVATAMTRTMTRTRNPVNEDDNNNSSHDSGNNNIARYAAKQKRRKLCMEQVFITFWKSCGATKLRKQSTCAMECDSVVPQCLLLLQGGKCLLELPPEK